MKYLLLISAIICIGSSCQKSELPSALVGTWKLTEVFDKSTQTREDVPESGDIIYLSFKSDNSFSGKTFKNFISDGRYSLPANNAISFDDFSSTLIPEDKWGMSVHTTLMSCMLLSVSPCTPSELIITGKTMKIKTVLRYELVFKKVI